jgi:hypothetical protein
MYRQAHPHWSVVLATAYQSTKRGHSGPERTLAGAGQDPAYGFLRTLRLRTLGRGFVCSLLFAGPFDFLTGFAMFVSSRRTSDFEGSHWGSGQVA